MAKQKSVEKYLQNRELSWLDFNSRCLDQATDKTVPLLEQLKFVSIYQSNLAEFFRVRVGSLSDSTLLKKIAVDNKSGMTPVEQIDAIHEECHKQQVGYEKVFNRIMRHLKAHGVSLLSPHEMDAKQLQFIEKYAAERVAPYLVPQVVNIHHPFPHLENGALYAIAHLKLKGMPDSGRSKNDGRVEPAQLGIIPVPSQCPRIVRLPGDGSPFTLSEQLVELLMPQVFSMYEVKQVCTICITRNADLDTTESLDEETDFLKYMKKVLRKRRRLAPVRLESSQALSPALAGLLQDRLGLTQEMCYVNSVPLDMGFAYDLDSIISPEIAAELSYEPFKPQWPIVLNKDESVIKQIEKRDVLCSYPYETMDVFLTLVREAVHDPDVLSIKITLYRVASNSRLCSMLCEAAEAGKEVKILFELRARFDEDNNIDWAQRCKDAGCHVFYGFRDYKVHSKVCLITRQAKDGVSYITQIGTGNYNEKTARLYCDLSLITAHQGIGVDAEQFFRNAEMECVNEVCTNLMVAPLQIKQMVFKKINEQIALAYKGEPCGLFFRTNSITDLEIINKFVEASRAGVPITLFVRGICCIVPGVPGATENIRVVSVIGRLLEHARVYAFGPLDSADCEVYISSADLMTRNMDHRVEIACPIYSPEVRQEIIDQVNLYLSDNVKLREKQSDTSYTPLGYFQKSEKSSKKGQREQGEKQPIDAQAILIAAGGTRHANPAPASQQGPWASFVAWLRSLFK